MYKYLTALLAGALATLSIIFASQKPKNVTVDGDYIESNKVKDQSKIKIKNGMFGWLKRDPEKKKANKIKRYLRKSKK